MDGHKDMPVSASETKLTFQDFLNFPEDGRRHELIDGEHYVTASPATKHQRIVLHFAAALYNYFQGNPVGEVFISPFDVVLSDIDVLVPDLLIVLADQAGIVTDLRVHGAPAIVVEILSPSTRRRDMDLKRRVYDARGVREYWIVDPRREVITTCRRAGDRGLVREPELLRAEHDSLSSPLLPGLSMALGGIFKN